MARIKIKGMLDLLEVPDSEAQVLKGRFQRREVMPDEIVTCGEFTGEARQVIAIFIIPPTPFRQTSAEEYALWRQEFVLKSPEEKGSTISSIFRLYYYCFEGIEPSEELIQTARDKSIVFFRENPNRTFPDLLMFYPLIPCIAERTHCKITLLTNRGLEALLLCMYQDKENAENIFTSPIREVAQTAQPYLEAERSEARNGDNKTVSNYKSNA